METMGFTSGDALLIVDVQQDFCPGGALPITEGDRVVPVINTWLRKAGEAGVPVFASRDWHPRNHLSFTTEGGAWPPHCLQDSTGAGFHPLLELPPDVTVVTKGVRFDQDQNSAFDQTGFGEHLKRKGVRRLFVAGLALDVCVLATVMDARKLGIDVVLIAEATRPVDAENGRNSVERMRAQGVTVWEGRPAETGGLDACTKAPEWAEHQRSTDIDEPCDDGRSA